MHILEKVLERSAILHWENTTMLMPSHVNVSLPLGHALGQQTAFKQQDGIFLSHFHMIDDSIALLTKESMYMDVNECLVECEQMFS